LERNRGKHLLILVILLLLIIIIIIIIVIIIVFLRIAALQVWSWFPLGFSNLSFFQCGIVSLISNPQSWRTKP
jgi:H+/Cl- antiporter ClcA